jgi:hypothetical protein
VLVVVVWFSIFGAVWAVSLSIAFVSACGVAETDFTADCHSIPFASFISIGIPAKY